MTVATQVRTILPGEVRNVSVDFTGELSGGVLTGTPTLSVGGSGLTLSSPAVSTGPLTINGATVATGAAVTFVATASSGIAGGTYTVSITVGTTSTPAETLVGKVKLIVP